MSWNRLIQGGGSQLQSGKKVPSREDSLQFSDNKVQPAHRHFEDSLNNFHVAFSTPMKSTSERNRNDEVLVSYSQLLEVLDLISQANHKVEELEKRLLSKPLLVQVATQTQVHQHSSGYPLKRGSHQ